jgi:hypothetical protein
MKKTLILSICTILLPLIAHTQKQFSDSSKWNKLDSLRIERRLVVLGVRSLDYYIEVNSNLRLEIQSLTKMNAVNVAYIEQLEGDLSHLRQLNDDEIKSKKKWRNATLLIISGIVVYLAL